MTTSPSLPPAFSLSSEMELAAYRRLFPLPFYERHLSESIRPDARSLTQSRSTTIALGPVTNADGSALVKIGETAMLAAVKLEVMTPDVEFGDQGRVVIEFHMPAICSPTVRPGRPSEMEGVISKQIEDVVTSSGMVDLKELSLVNGKAAWMAYLDIYCLNADGSLFDAALLSAIAAFSHLQIPLVSLNEEGRVIALSGERGGYSKLEAVNKEKRKLNLKGIPFSLTCMIHKHYIFVDPTAEEESTMDTAVTIVIDSQDRLVAVYKAGGSALVHNSSLKECISLAKRRGKELQEIMVDSMSSVMEVASD